MESFSQSDDLLQLWTGYIDYMRRRVNFQKGLLLFLPVNLVLLHLFVQYRTICTHLCSDCQHLCFQTYIFNNPDEPAKVGDLRAVFQRAVDGLHESKFNNCTTRMICYQSAFES